MYELLQCLPNKRSFRNLSMNSSCRSGPLVTIEALDGFYLAMPQALDSGDGSQDALRVRLRGGQ